MLFQYSVIELKFGLESQRGPLTQKIPPSNWSTAGILGPDLVSFPLGKNHTTLNALVLD